MMMMMKGLPARVILMMSCLCLCLCHLSVHAQSAAEPVSTPNGRIRISLNFSLYLMIIALVSAFAFMGLFVSLSLRYCWRSNAALINPTVRIDYNPHGVDPAVLESFPVFVYSHIKEHKIGKGGHECAVCLSEFQDCDTLLLLPKCDHIFHTHCITAWLAHHASCPVCRANLADTQESCGNPTAMVDLSTTTTNPALETDPVNSNVNGDQSREKEQQVVITVYSDDSSAVDLRRTAEKVQNDGGNAPKENRQVPKSRMLYSLQRSHTTGHSLVLPGENRERYKLRLPEEVRNQLLANHVKLRNSASYDVVLCGQGIAFTCVRCNECVI